MGEQSRAPIPSNSSGRWREPPRRFGKIEYDHQLAAIERAGDRFEIICCFGCGLFALAAIAAAAIAWGDALLVALAFPR